MRLPALVVIAVVSVSAGQVPVRSSASARCGQTRGANRNRPHQRARRVGGPRSGPAARHGEFVARASGDASCARQCRWRSRLRGSIRRRTRSFKCGAIHSTATRHD